MPMELDAAERSRSNREPDSLRSIRHILAIAAAWIGIGSVHADESARSSVGRILEEFEIAPDGDLVLLPVSIGVRTFRFVVSTGIPGTKIDSTLLTLPSELAVEDQALDTNSDVKTNASESVEARIGRQCIRVPSRPEKVDLRAIQAALGVECVGELGMDALRDSIIQIDFDEGRFRFLSAVAEDPGEAIPITFHGKNRIPTIPLLIPDAAMERFAIATSVGLPLTLSDDLFEILEDTGHFEAITRVACSHRKGYTTLGNFEQVKLATMVIPNVNVLPQRANYAGIGFLSRFLLTCDFPAGKVYLKPGKRFNQPELPWSYPLVEFDREADGIKIIETDVRCPLRKLGMKAGDLVVAVNSHPALRYSNWMLGRLLSAPSTRIELRREDTSLRIPAE